MFKKQYESVSFTDDGVVETKGEKGFLGNEEETTSFYSLEEYEAKLANRGKQEVAQNGEAMEAFEGAESSKLTDAVEQWNL